MNRARNRDVIYQQAVSQYTIEGEWVADFKSMYAAGEAAGVFPESIMDVIHKEFLTAGGFRWFLQSCKPKKEDFIIADKVDTSGKLLNLSLWKKLGKPAIDKKNPPPCMNLSVKDLPGEHWKPIPGFGNRFAISDKGRIKRLSGWISSGRKIFLREQILSQIMEINGNTKYSLYCILRHTRESKRATITKLLYYCFVEEFDLNDNTMVVVNQNDPLWDIDISKLKLRSIYRVLKGK
ncbi:NUMOD4 domain-containing protein [Chryseobacterium soldanellicola]|uniref:NUMOD4 domain-containing protein n=1 Tax=Chryseobacterium soldanellicola TaxID=311333 RepID=UPI000B7DF534|nr:NUMOD4 domain-containing protein [Chryseobacterium soldanellicola]